MNRHNMNPVDAVTLTLRSARIMNLTKKAYGVWAMGYTPTREFHTMDRWINLSLYSDARHNANQDRARAYADMLDRAYCERTGTDIELLREYRNGLVGPH